MRGRGFIAGALGVCVLLLPAAGADAAKKTKVKAASVSVAEGTAPAVSEAVLTVKVSPKPKKAVKVKFETIDGTATAPADYTQDDGTLKFEKGQRSRELRITLAGDTLDESDETFRVRLKTTGKKHTTAEPTVTISDDDTTTVTPPPPPPPDPTTSEQIAALRAATDGPVSLAIEDATVTYVKPLVGSEAAGFFVQAAQAGPAVYVAIDPTSLSPAPVAGDVVTFTATAKATVSGQSRVTTLTGYTRTATGANVSALVQDVSSAGDLVSSLSSYESEVIDLDATISGAFLSAGPSHLSAPITTAGLPGVDPNLLRLRVSDTVVSSLDLAQGCDVRVENTPLWRLNAQAQPSAWTASDLTVESCPAPKLLSAVATSSTGVTLTFDRLIDPTVLEPNGEQFSFDGGLTASAPIASGKTVTITTSAQTIAQAYAVTVDPSVTDTLGEPVDPSNDSTTFAGFTPVADLLLNEVSPDVAGDQDLIELRALTGGSVQGITVESRHQDTDVLATLPNLIVAAGDLIVVHVSPTAGTVTTETTSKTQCASGTFPACYDGAWDIAGTDETLAKNDRVLRVADGPGNILDAVPFTNEAGPNNNGFPPNLQAIQTAGEWSPANCGGSPCAYMSAPNAFSVSVDWTAVGNTPTGNSVRRIAATDTNLAADWAVGAQTFGAANP